ncbi:hypothetical protein [Piscirickettsia litoralis]|uniref:SnoaL-like domain-containing protein n=1 Tax=Piscirickettsia litoralis TaxID=1891921 RepID=A0ABX2ZYZ6_9GAMM|nr:hypothetical protein [Piscirickettsia litoralis]ODN41816.1 hypothetical protein BGC07_01005 [Piscirickettsia litoralis]
MIHTKSALNFINELKESLWLGLDLKKITQYYDTSLIGDESGRLIRFGDITQFFQARASKQLPAFVHIDIEDCLAEERKIFIRINGRFEDGSSNRAHLSYHLNNQNKVIRLWSLLEDPRKNAEDPHIHAIKFLV